MGDAAVLFEAVLRNTPASSNPFEAIDLTFTTQLFFPAVSRSFTNRLWAFSLIFAAYSLVQAAIVAGSLIIRAKRQAGRFWVFRLTKTEGGSLVTPHHATAWQLATLAFLITLIPYSLATLAFSQGNVPQNVMAWRLMPWIAAWGAAWLGTWSICVEGALLPTSAAGRLDWTKSPAFMNTHFVGIGVVCAVAMSTLAAVSSQRYDATLNVLHTLQQELVIEGALFPNMTLEEIAAGLEEPLLTAQTMLDSFHSFLSVFRLAWGGWVFFTAYLYAVFVTVALNHFVNLSNVVGKIEEKELGAESEANNALMEASLNASWWNITWAVGLMTLACVVYGANFIWLAVTADPSTQLPSVIQVETLLPLYGFVVFGTITSLLILHRALHITLPPLPSVLPTALEPSPSDDSSGSSSTLQSASDFTLDDPKCPPSPGMKVVTEWATPNEQMPGSVRPSSEVLKHEFSFRLDTWEGDLPELLLSDEDVSDGTKTGDLSPNVETPGVGSPLARSPEAKSPVVKSPELPSSPQASSPGTGSPAMRSPETGSPETTSPEARSPKFRSPEAKSPALESP